MEYFIELYIVEYLLNISDNFVGIINDLATGSKKFIDADLFGEILYIWRYW